jgi:hypothetical protein
MLDQTRGSARTGAAPELIAEAGLVGMYDDEGACGHAGLSGE